MFSEYPLLSSLPAIVKRVKSRKGKAFFGRFPQKAKASYVLAKKNDDGTMEFSQFPDDISGDSQYCRPVQLVEPQTPRKKSTGTVFETPNGTRMDFERTQDVTVISETGELVSRTLFFLSPIINRTLPRKPIFERKPAEPLGIFLTNPPANLSTESGRKGGIAMKVNSEKRDRKSLKSQQDVFGVSAREALGWFLQNKETSISPDVRKIMEDIMDNHQTEFLHCYAVCLCPEDINPQTKENLGIGSAWTNTSMMVLEIVAKKLAKMEHLNVEVISQFLTFPGTHVISEVMQEIRVTKQLDEGKIRTVLFSNQIKPLDPSQNNRKLLASSTDIELTFKVAGRFLEGQVPLILDKPHTF